MTLVLLTCLSIDFSSPLLPGVVRFNDSESVYAVRADRPRTEERSAATSHLPTLGSRPSDLMVGLPRATMLASERPRSVPATVRPRGLPSTPPAPAPAAGDDH